MMNAACRRTNARFGKVGSCAWAENIHLIMESYPNHQRCACACAADWHSLASHHSVFPSPAAPGLLNLQEPAHAAGSHLCGMRLIHEVNCCECSGKQVGRPQYSWAATFKERSSFPGTQLSALQSSRASPRGRERRTEFHLRNPRHRQRTRASAHRSQVLDHPWFPRPRPQSA